MRRSPKLLAKDEYRISRFHAIRDATLLIPLELVQLMTDYDVVCGHLFVHAEGGRLHFATAPQISFQSGSSGFTENWVTLLSSQCDDNNHIENSIVSYCYQPVCRPRDDWEPPNALVFNHAFRPSTCLTLCPLFAALRNPQMVPAPSSSSDSRKARFAAASLNPFSTDGLAKKHKP